MEQTHLFDPVLIPSSTILCQQAAIIFTPLACKTLTKTLTRLSVKMLELWINK